MNKIKEEYENYLKEGPKCLEFETQKENSSKAIRQEKQMGYQENKKMQTNVEIAK